LLLADSFYDSGLEFLAVGAAEVEFVAGEAGWDGVARFPFAGSVSLGAGGFVFAGVNHALKVDYYSTKNGICGELAEDFGFGLVPVFEVMAFDGSLPMVELGGAAADSFSHLRRVVPGAPRHIRIASRIQDC
jgi:hypothetical protein